MAISHTVLEFAKVEFPGNWRRSCDGTKFIYTHIAIESPGDVLIVVTESETGVFSTYYFNHINDEVWIDMNENVIHIPAHCHRKLEGDQMKCTQQ